MRVKYKEKGNIVHEKVFNAFFTFPIPELICYRTWICVADAPRTRGLIQDQQRFSTSSESNLESPSRKKSDKPRGSRRANSTSSASESPRRSITKQQQLLPGGEGESTSTANKTSSRRKKTKSSSSSRTSTKSKSTAPPVVEFSHYSDPGIGGSGGGGGNSSSSSRNAEQTTTGRRSKGKDTCQSSFLKPSPDKDDLKGLDDNSRGIQAL